MAVREREDVRERGGLRCARRAGAGPRELSEEVGEAEPDGAIVDVGGECGDECVCDEAGVEEELV